jgi:hypothetical protein
MNGVDDVPAVPIRPLVWRAVNDRIIKVADLVGTVEIAQRLGVRDHNVVNNWRRRHHDFPEPVTTLRHGRIWAWPDVERWAARTGRLKVIERPQPA